MGRFILIILLAFSIGVAYSYIIKRLFNNKLLLFLPSILSTLWFVYILTLYSPKQTEGFEDLGIIIIAMMVLTLLLGNIISGLILIYRDKNNH